MLKKVIVATILTLSSVANADAYKKEFEHYIRLDTQDREKYTAFLLSLDWYNVLEKNHGDFIYQMNLSKVGKINSDGITKVWVKSLFQGASDHQVYTEHDYSLELYQYDCDKKNFILLQSRIYKMDGRVNKNINAPRLVWKPIIDGSDDEKIFQAACFYAAFQSI